MSYKMVYFQCLKIIIVSDIFWVKPKIRGVIDPYKVTLRKKLKRLLNKNPYTLKINTDFIGVIEGVLKQQKLEIIHGLILVLEMYI